MGKQSIETFKNVVEATPDISSGYRGGLQALGTNSKKINAPDMRLVGGSVDIDGCTKNLYPEEPRWDYAFDYNGEVFYVEVHPACECNISEMEAKLKWLKNWLKTKAPEIEKRTATRCPYCWVHSGGMRIPQTGSSYRRLAKLGLRPVREWTYPN